MSPTRFGHLLRWELHRAWRSTALLLVLLGIGAVIVLRDLWSGLAQMLPAVNAFVAAIGAAMVTQAETPLVPTRFASGKPIGRAALAGAKAFTITLCFLVVPLSVMATALLLSGAQPSAVSRDLGEAAAFLVLYVVSCSAIGALTSNVRQLFAAMLGGVLTVVVFGFLRRNLAIPEVPMLLVSVALSVLAVAVAYRGALPRRASFPAAMVVAASVLVATVEGIMSSSSSSPVASRTVAAVVDSVTPQPDGLVRVAFHVSGSPAVRRFTPMLALTEVEVNDPTRTRSRLSVADIRHVDGETAVRASWRETRSRNARGESTTTTALTLSHTDGQSTETQTDEVRDASGFTISRGSSSATMRVAENGNEYSMDVPSPPVFDGSAVLIVAPVRRGDRLPQSATLRLFLTPIVLRDTITTAWSAHEFWHQRGERLTLHRETGLQSQWWALTWSATARDTGPASPYEWTSALSWTEAEAQLPGEAAWRPVTVGGTRTQDGGAVLPGASRQRATVRLTIPGVREIPAGTRLRIRLWVPERSMQVLSPPFRIGG